MFILCPVYPLSRLWACSNPLSLVSPALSPHRSPWADLRILSSVTISKPSMTAGLITIFHLVWHLSPPTLNPSLHTSPHTCPAPPSHASLDSQRQWSSFWPSLYFSQSKLCCLSTTFCRNSIKINNLLCNELCIFPEVHFECCKEALRRGIHESPTKQSSSFWSGKLYLAVVPTALHSSGILSHSSNFYVYYI